ncbi:MULTISPECIES: hypothetical protein [Serratia]|uniref:hypothetical protein n=1 Tax=Serratia TaxID=613 RepID=UPI0013D8E329|nr:MULTISPECIES: hypothetical protein [Serratia]MBH2656217.1 hypothetical protein [Serratia ureilytica]MBJ2092181.1 hypothetical protein [Serratia ureilytica]HBC5194907.1 hypothetical protein [Serratia marcescens]
MADSKKVNLDELKKQFGPLQVPSETHFSQLIDVAALSFQAGPGLAGGVPAVGEEGLDVGGVTPLYVKALGGMQATADGVALHVAATGGLALDSDNRLTAPVAPKGGLHNDGGLAVKAMPPLTVGREVSVAIDPHQGMACSAAGLALQVDATTLETDADGLRVKCQLAGGMTIKDTGELALDLDIILGRACIRVHHGRAFICLPKSQVTAIDKTMIFINSIYTGEIRKGGERYYVKEAWYVAVTDYWVVETSEWVKAGDVIQVRGPEEQYIHLEHTVTARESAPVNRLPQITDLKITVQGGGAARVGSTLEAAYTFDAHGAASSEVLFSWEWYDPSRMVWVRVSSNKTFLVPPGYQRWSMRVLLTPANNCGPSSSSAPITIAE